MVQPCAIAWFPGFQLRLTGDVPAPVGIMIFAGDPNMTQDSRFVVSVHQIKDGAVKSQWPVEKMARQDLRNEQDTVGGWCATLSSGFR